MLSKIPVSLMVLALLVPELHVPAFGQSGRFENRDFGRLLERYVDSNGWVDYRGLAADRNDLDAYLARLGSANTGSLANDAERLAFWINAYNAFTLADALDSVYGKVRGVKDVSGFFNGKRHRVAGEELALDDIESRGRKLGDPRIHFAIVCASTSCPKLQRFAYTGAELDAQLERVTREFLADPARGLRVDRERKRIYLSPIFKWYAGDFTGETSGAGRLLALGRAVVSGGDQLGYARRYAPAEAARFIDEARPSVHYLDYDWMLNSQENHGRTR